MMQAFDEFFHAPGVDHAPDAVVSSRSETDVITDVITIAIAALTQAVDPSEAQRFVQGLAIRESAFAGIDAVEPEQQFRYAIMVLFQPLTKGGRRAK